MADKAQTVRLLDVWVIGPGVLWLSALAEKSARTPTQRLGVSLMAVVGVATILYNGLNYLDERDRIQT